MKTTNRLVMYTLRRALRAVSNYIAVLITEHSMKKWPHSQFVYIMVNAQIVKSVSIASEAA